MKTVLSVLGCVMAMASMAVGQGVSVSLALDQEQYLPGETLLLKVRISNDSGQQLTLGQDDKWLTVVIEDSNHLVVPRQGTLPVRGEFTLESSTTGTRKVDLAPYFDLSHIGRYFVTATVNLPSWGQAISGKTVSFDIIRGNSLWEKDFGVPVNASEPGAAPELRRYSLVQTSHSRKLGLYFRLSETRELKVIRTFQLGPMVGFGQLEPQIDRFSNLHVLYQTGGKLFVHCVINPDGILIARETYEYSETRPLLRFEDDGRISVKGGVRRVGATDLPPP
jgi:hypothetical protein